MHGKDDSDSGQFSNSVSMEKESPFNVDFFSFFDITIVF